MLVTFPCLKIEQFSWIVLSSHATASATYHTAVHKQYTFKGPSIIVNVFSYEQNSHKEGGGSKGQEKCWISVLICS